MLTRQQFIDIIGEDPVDVLGNDWKNEVEEYMNDDNEHFHDGHQRGGCFDCKMD